VAPAAAAALTPVQVAQLYQFPTSQNGQGQTIGIIELGGGYTPSDLQTFFSKLGLPQPTVVSVSVDGAQNSPSQPPAGPDYEVALDIEVAGAVAPASRIAVYFAPNTDQGFLDAVGAAIDDTANDPAVISISWGGPESSWTAQSMDAFEQRFQDAAALGITVFCASGDNGSSDGVSDGRAHVDFPASAPHATGCGGTHLEASGTTISSEVTWSGSGGGVSDHFPLPTWQNGAGVPPSVNPGGRVGRGVPDVAGDADPATGYEIVVGGSNTTVGGTSAVAPLWSGLTALLNQGLGKRAGFLNPQIYQPAERATFGDITGGGNGGYSARPGWDACTGWGSPRGQALLDSLRG
jgi:kumamolisin